ncbi:hypothetical protein CDAR_125431 [Caerostris darwini]|uniref:Uncharacterized protein n=1 Tax=Caerostris darwini TaxID=1538125 RepID=A0AAV4M3V7_9ARAC|nr:hypothetical protein CDAR_125431 [Caerostris darwini]
MHLDCADAVARFRHTTSHDYLHSHLPRSLASEGICPLCGISNMGGDHLRNCIEHIDAPDINAHYWETRCRMAEQPHDVLQIVIHLSI